MTQIKRAAEGRDAARDDPVTPRLAALPQTNVGHIDLIGGLMFATMLEGVASFCWFVTLHLRDVKALAHDVAQSIDPPLTPIVTDSRESASPLSRDNAERVGDDSELSRLARDIAAGRLRMTVAAIRLHLGSSQAKPIALRRPLSENQLSFT